MHKKDENSISNFQTSEKNVGFFNTGDIEYLFVKL